MLLYDRLMEAAARAARFHMKNGTKPTSDESDIAWRLSKSAVYDITNVVPLFHDWNRYRKQPVPKRPPHPVTWCEWRVDEPGEAGGSYIRWKVGTLITENSPCDFFRWADSAAPGPSIPGGSSVSWRDRVRPRDFIYGIIAFSMIEDSVGLEESDSLGLGRLVPALHLPGNLLAISESGEYVGGSLLFPKAAAGATDIDYAVQCSVFGLNTAVSTLDYNFSDQFHTYWPPFMAFSLLHCKNVEAVEHVTPESVQRKVRKAGNPPRVTYKTISLKVPETHGPRGDSTPDPEAKGSTRFHLCRGHFKNLSHPRFKSPGLHWWPAHWRGNADQGVVITDRKLEPA